MTTDERIERVAAAMANADADNGGNWYSDEEGEPVFPRWENLPDGLEADVGGDYQEWLIRGKEHYRRQARAAIAVDVDAEPLDVMMQDAGLICIQVDLLYTGRLTETWQAMALRRDEEWGAEEQPYGHGETPMAAIRAAVANAKETM